MPVLHTFLSFPDGVFQKLSDEVLEDLLCMDAEGFVYCIDGCGIVQLLCIDRASASADAKGFAVLAFFLEDRAQMIPVIDFRIFADDEILVVNGSDEVLSLFHGSVADADLAVRCDDDLTAGRGSAVREVEAGFSKGLQFPHEAVLVDPFVLRLFVEINDEISGIDVVILFNAEVLGLQENVEADGINVKVVQKIDQRLDILDRFLRKRDGEAEAESHGLGEAKLPDDVGECQAAGSQDAVAVLGFIRAVDGNGDVDLMIDQELDDFLIKESAVRNHGEFQLRAKQMLLLVVPAPFDDVFQCVEIDERLTAVEDDFLLIIELGHVFSRLAGEEGEGLVGRLMAHRILCDLGRLDISIAEKAVFACQIALLRKDEVGKADVRIRYMAPYIVDDAFITVCDDEILLQGLQRFIGKGRLHTISHGLFKDFCFLCRKKYRLHSQAVIVCGIAVEREAVHVFRDNQFDLLPIQEFTGFDHQAVQIFLVHIFACPFKDRRLFIQLHMSDFRDLRDAAAASADKADIAVAAGEDIVTYVF